MPLLERVEHLAGGALWATAAVAFLAAIFLLLCRVPARAAVIFDGAKACRRTSREAIILNGVHNVERPLYPWLVDDLVQFQTRDGQEIRVTMRRRFRSDPPSLVWYAPANPRRVTALSPLRCFGFACLCMASAIWLGW